MNHLPKARVIGVMVVGLLNCEAAQISAPRAATAPPAALVGDTAANGASMPVLSADGKYAAFVSRAPNLVTNPTTGKYQIFLRNLTNGGLILVSTTPAGTGGNGHSMLPSFSSSGIWIAFESDASDLVPDDTNGVTDIFIRDIGHQTTWMVTGGNGPSRNPMRSSNGCIAFDSRASNLVPDDNNDAQDVFINGGDPETTALVSVNLAGTGSADGASELLAITPNGRFVAFWSDATDIISGAVNDAGEVYVRDVQAGVSYCLTKGLGIFGNNRRLKIALTPDGQYAALQELSYGGAAPGGRLFRADVFGGSISNIYCCGWPGPGLAISDDGSRLIFPGSDGLYLRDMLSTNRLLVRDPVSAFQSPLNIESFQVSRNFDRLWFTMLVTNRGQQLFSYDIATDQTSLVSTNPMGQAGNGAVASPFSISDSGERVAFETGADDLEPNDLNRAPDIYVSNFGLASRRHSALPERTGLGYATLKRGSLSANGTRLSFLSTDTSLIANDKNGHHDLFVRDLAADQVFNIGSGPSNSVVDAVMSADGAWLIYDRLGGQEFLSTRGDVYRANLRTGEIRSLETAGGRGLRYRPHLSVSQDGRWVAFRSTDRIRLSALGQATNQVVDLRYDGIVAGNAPSSNPTISLDGEWVVFESRATDLVETGPYLPGVPQVYARNLLQQRTRLLSITHTGAPLLTGATNPVLSANARYVAFETYSGSNIYLHDLLATGQVTNLLICSNCSRPSISGDGQAIAYLSQGQVYISLVGGGVETFAGATDVTEVALSIDGRFVAWASRESGISQIYLHDRWNTTRHLLSRSYLDTGGGNSHSTRPVFSHDGRTIAFQSFASDLVPGDYNGRRDIFVVQIVQVDTDSDGMDDDWETHYFQSLARDGSGNVDGDHLNDRDEFLAGTNPLDPTSALRFTGIFSRVVAGPVQDTELKWASAPGKAYRVQHRPDLAAPWSDLTGDITTGGPNGSATHLDPAHQTGFYRLLLAP